MRRAVLAFAVLALPSLLLEAQEKDVVFKSSSSLVVFDVTVRDKSGTELSNLRKEDFTVVEDGKPQTLSVFEFQKLGTESVARAAPPSLLTSRTPAAAVARQPMITTAKPGQVQYQDRRLMVLLFDFSAMQIPEQIRAQTAALKFLNEQMSKSDLVSIMTVSSSLKVEQDFTDDRELLTQVIKGFKIGNSSDLAVEGGNGDDASGQDNGTAYNADETEFNIFNTDNKLASLAQAAKMLASLPEKKALVYFSSGIGKQGVENQSQLRSTINTAVRSNVSFYPIDTRGLVALPPGGDASANSPRGNSIYTGAAHNTQKSKFNDQQETLVSLAADTGGKAFLDDNDLGRGIVNAQNDVRSYYILGYYSTNDKQDGKFRRVQIKLANGLQAKLDYRSGYFGSKTFAKFTGADREGQLQEALMLGDPLTDLPLAVETDYFRIGKSNYFVPISVKVPGSAIELAMKSGKGQTEFEFIGQIRDSKGKLAASVRDGIKVKLDEANASLLSKRAIQYDGGFTLAPGDYKLKFLARENLTGKMGTFESAFTIPDLTAQTTGMKTSSVIWSSQRQALKEAVGSAGANKKELAKDPLVQDGQKIVPSITRVFRKDQNLYVYMEVYDAGTDPSVSAVLTFYHGKTKAFQSSPVRLTEAASGRPGTVPVKFQVPLASLAPGKYICQVNLIDEGSRRFAFPRTNFVLLAAANSTPAQ